MLKKSLFSPARPRRAETRLFPCGVLASFRPSTYPRGYVEGLHPLRPCWTNFFEHPAGVFHCCATDEDHRSSSVAILFFRSLLVIRVREALFVKALEPGVGGPNQTPTWLSTRLAAVQDPSALAALTERQEEAFFQIV